MGRDDWTALPLGAQVTAMNADDGAPLARWTALLGATLVHASAIVIAGLTLLLAAQPILANDAWIHLALGEAFATFGPWLEADPHLFAAPGPPSPSSWLGSAALFGIWSAFGFEGLRVFHALWVALVLGLAWTVIRRASGSAIAASLGLVLFVLLATYRLAQLRPDLFSLAAVLALYLLLFAPKRGPGPGAIAGALVLSVVWVNVHAGFLLGPILVLSGAAGLFLYSLLPGAAGAAIGRSRAVRVGIAGVSMAIVTLANPQGLDAHLAYFASGGETLPLGAIADEWRRTNLLARPIPRLPPTFAAWLVCWLCLIAVVLGAFRLFFLRRPESAPDAAAEEGARAAADAGATREGMAAAGRPADGDTAESSAIDPALLTLAAAGVVAAILATRFLWLGVFALALLGALAHAAARRGWLSRFGSLLAAAAAILAIGLHWAAGDWPLVSRAIGAGFDVPYHASRYYAHSMWFLADSQVEGRIYNDYPLGGFMSFWLTPRLQMASSGTMNVEREAMETNFAVASRVPAREGEDYAAMLDRMGFDLFLGAGLPLARGPGQPVASTIRHLEGEPGWMPVYRGMRSAVYLRRNERNRENLERIRAYYAAAGVPFDLERGFVPEQVIVKSPDWAIEHGVIPSDFSALVGVVRTQRSKSDITPQMSRLAIVFCMLGIYERALDLDRFVLRLDPVNGESARRAIWTLLQLGRAEEALVVAEDFEEAVRNSDLVMDTADDEGRASSGWVAMVEEVLAASEADRATIVAHLPLLQGAQRAVTQVGRIDPEARTERSPSPR